MTHSRDSSSAASSPGSSGRSGANSPSSAVLSLVANLLMLSPTLYMLQIFDRVLTSQNELTLLMLSLIILLFFGVMALAEWIRSRLLVRAGVRFDEALNDRIFRAGFQRRARAIRPQLRPGAGRPHHHPPVPDRHRHHRLLRRAVDADLHRRDVHAAPVPRLAVDLLRRQPGGPRPSSASGRSAKPAEERVQGRGRSQPVPVQQAAQLGSGRVDGHAGRSAPALGRSATRTMLGIQSRVAGREPAHDRDGQVPPLYAAVVLAGRGRAARDPRRDHDRLDDRRQRADVARVAADRSHRLDLEHVSCRPAARSAASASLLDAHPDEASGPPRRAAGRPDPLAGPRRHRAESRGADPQESSTADFPAGQFTAIIGPSGSGKSTLARTADRDLAVHRRAGPARRAAAGRAGTATALGPAIGYLPQDIELFDGTIAENIARFGEVRCGQGDRGRAARRHARDDPAHAQGLRHADRRRRQRAVRRPAPAHRRSPARSTATRA